MMEAATMISLSDKVISDCKLLDAEMVLVDTPLGLCLKWMLTEKGNKAKKMYSVPITENKTLGKLYPVQLNAELELAIFGKRLETAKHCSESCVACIIVCDTGVVLAAHRKLPEVLCVLCHHDRGSAWAGVLKGDSDRCAVVVVHKGGTIHIGIPGKKPSGNGTGMSARFRSSSLLWHIKTLEMSPIVCCGNSNVLFLSDGTTSWLSVFDVMGNGEVDYKCYKLPYCGIIKVMNVTTEKLDLFTCDGRTYKCEWKHILAHIKSEKSTPKPSEKDVFTVEEVMTGIQRCSQLVQAEGKHVHDLDVYMSQLTLAASLLVEPQKDIFSASVKIERLERKGTYIALVNIKKNLSHVELEGKWWKLNITVPGYACKETLCVRLDEQDLSKDLNISVPLPNLDLHSLVCIKITCHLILGHYSTFHPVCQILVCHANVNMFHFLTPKHLLKNTTIASTNFTSAIQNLALKRQLSGTRRTADYSPLPSCNVKLSFVANDVNRKLFIALLNLNSLSVSDVITAEDANQVQLWYHDIPVDIQYMQLNKRMTVTLRGANPFIVLSAKAAIEREVNEHGSVLSQVTLAADVCEQAQRSRQILEFESSQATTQAAVSHLHQMIAKLLCSVPL